MDPIRVSSRVVVPPEAMLVRAVRSGGPGGQNVNRVATKVELRVDLDRIVGLSPPQRARLGGLARSRLDAEGWLLVTSQRTRHQARNLEDAREKARDLVARALPRPQPRIPTKASKASKRRRLDAKRRQSDKKRERRAIRND